MRARTLLQREFEHTSQIGGMAVYLMSKGLIGSVKDHMRNAIAAVPDTKRAIVKGNYRSFCPILPWTRISQLMKKSDDI